MSKWAATYESFTPTTHSNASNLTDNGYFAIVGGTATQRFDVYEIMLVGQTTVSGNMNSIVWTRNSLNAGGLTAMTSIQSNAALDPASATPTSSPVAFSAATTKPQRSSTAAKLSLGFNPFGGIVRWWTVPGSGSEYKLLGNTSLGECSISATSVGTPAAMMATIQYELF